jgi:hypothetical protein
MTAHYSLIAPPSNMIPIHSSLESIFNYKSIPELSSTKISFFELRGSRKLDKLSFLKYLRGDLKKLKGYIYLNRSQRQAALLFNFTIQKKPSGVSR